MAILSILCHVVILSVTAIGAGFSSLGNALALNYNRLLLRYESGVSETVD